MSEKEESEAKRVRELAYKNQRRLDYLYEQYDLLRQELLAIEEKLKVVVPAPTEQLDEVKKRLTSLENMMEMYLEAIQKVITKPSAAEVMLEAEQKLKKASSWVDPSIASALLGRKRKKREIPTIWKDLPSEEDELIAQDRRRWEQELRRNKVPSLDPEIELGIPTNIEDKMSELSDTWRKKKKEEEDARYKKYLAEKGEKEKQPEAKK